MEITKYDIESTRHVTSPIDQCFANTHRSEASPQPGVAWGCGNCRAMVFHEMWLKNMLISSELEGIGPWWFHDMNQVLLVQWRFVQPWGNGLRWMLLGRSSTLFNNQIQRKSCSYSFTKFVDHFNLRSLYQEMLSRMPTNISLDDDLVPGGDIRIRGNSWLRSAFKATQLESVPRETQFRLAVGKIMAKRKVGPWD